MRKENSIVPVRANHVQGQHPTQVKGKRNVKRKNSMDNNKMVEWIGTQRQIEEL